MPQNLLFRGAPDYIGAHQIKHAHNLYFILFVSSRLGMCDRLKLPRMQWQIKLPVVTPALGSFCERVEYSLTYLSFASFNVPYNPVRLMYEKTS